MFDLTTLEAGSSRIVPILVAPSTDALPAIVVRVVDANGSSLRRARRFKGECAHMDADRYMNDLAAQLRRTGSDG